MFGKYISKKGSYFVFHENNKFEYSKELHNFQTDIPVIEILETSKGEYRLVNKTIVLNSNKNYLDSIFTSSINLVEKQANKVNKDSIKINIEKHNWYYKVFICGTGIEIENNVNDVSGCYCLNNSLNTVPKFYTKFYKIKICPDIENHEFRESWSNINTLFIESKSIPRNDADSDIFIDIDFHILNFYFIDLVDEIVLIRKDRLLFRGEEYFFQVNR
jgi:hypothetical protein